jgi:RNA polymerase sigma-70 factor (ECF subfamily)
MENAADTTADERLAQRPDLAERFVRGEKAAFDELVRIYAAPVAALAFRLLGWRGDYEDVVQDVFVAALERAGKFRSGSSLWTWLVAITINRCRAKWRRRRVRELAAAFLPRREAEAHPSDRRTMDSETSAEVRRAVAALPAKLREVILLHYLQEMPVEEIARVVRTSRGAVEVRLHRGREKLRAVLARMIEE